MGKIYYTFLFFTLSGLNIRSFANQDLAHPFYISVIELEHNAQVSLLECSVKIFADDFEKALAKQGISIDVLKPKDPTVLEKVMEKYIREHVVINVNGANVGLQYLGYELQGEAIWNYFEVPHITQIKHLEVNTQLLYEYKQEQSIIIHCKYNGKQSSKRLENPDSKAIF